MTGLCDAGLTDIPVFSDDRGSLSFVEQQSHIPFVIKRMYYIYNTPTGAVRGCHAHKKSNVFMICMAGECTVTLIDCMEQSRSFHLCSPNKGLYVPANLWRVMSDFSEDCVLTVLSDEFYDENDYITDFDAFCFH